MNGKIVVVKSNFALWVVMNRKELGEHVSVLYASEVYELLINLIKLLLAARALYCQLLLQLSM